MKQIIALLAVLLLLLAACQSDVAPAPGEEDPVDQAQQDELDRDEEDEEQNSEELLTTSNWSLAIDTVALDGTVVTSADFAGNKLTVLNVWATWCGPCIGELPELAQIAEAYAGQGVQMVGVMQDGVDDAGEPLPNVIADGQALLADAGADYLVILPDEALNRALIDDMQFFPTTFFLNEKGEVIHSEIGSQDFQGWSDVIDGVLDGMD